MAAGVDAATYERAAEEARRFLERSERMQSLLSALKQRANVSLQIPLDHVADVLASPDLADAAARNALRYTSIFCDAVDALVPPLDVTDDASEPLDVLRMHRRARLARPAEGAAAADSDIPKLLLRRYHLHLVPRAAEARAPKAIRELRAGLLGRLVSVKGIVTRVSELKPMALVVTYVCDVCGYELYQEVRGAPFMPLMLCSSAVCRNAGGGGAGKLHESGRGSRFVQFQELRLQELAEQVPVGHIPRSLVVHAYADLTRLCAPGDLVSVHGVFLPIPHASRRNKPSLLADVYVEATHIEQHKRAFRDYVPTPAVQAAVDGILRQGNVYERLARSIAPEIFGLLDVKKALLLQLTGGVPRRLPDGVKLRGDMHVCLMGDPGVAKSQLLKHIAAIAPRGVYTSGKGSSGVGLTAAVLRDPVTNELVLEGGSLVLADMGVCCIDEFDKMDEADRTAIHEVMEQQSVSIAKAGITTSLNARTALLAAANPAYGRYNAKRSVAENLNLPAALLSRFDLLFVLLDVPSLDADLALARHVAHVHQHGAPPALDFTPVPADVLRAYVAMARTHEPHVPRELTDYIVSAYVRLRGDERGTYEHGSYCTARTLLSVLRLSQALARLRLGADVQQTDVDEALRLFHASKATLFEERARRPTTDWLSAIYNIVRDATPPGAAVLALAELAPKVLAKGYTQTQLSDCLARYESLDIWKVSSNNATLRWIQSVQ